MSSQGAKSGRSLPLAFWVLPRAPRLPASITASPSLHAISLILSLFHSSAGMTSIISVATQLGYASGLLVFVPLGDSVERRTWIVGSIIGTVLILLSTAFAPMLPFDSRELISSAHLHCSAIDSAIRGGYCSAQSPRTNRWNRHERFHLSSRSVKAGSFGARAGWQACFVFHPYGMRSLLAWSCLLFGVFLMDAGVQASHISNQTRIDASII